MRLVEMSHTLSVVTSKKNLKKYHFDVIFTFASFSERREQGQNSRAKEGAGFMKGVDIRLTRTNSLQN